MRVTSRAREQVLRRRSSSQGTERVYRDVLDVIRRHCERNPEVTEGDVLAVLGRAAGYCVGLHEPSDRDAARESVTTNMVMGEKHVVGEHS